MSASELIQITTPEGLYPSDPAEAKKKFHELALEWHPDRNKIPGAARVFHHIQKLYEEAVNKFEGGFWDANGLFKLKEKTGKSREIYYLAQSEFELGKFYVGKDHVTYLVGKAFEDLYDNFVEMTKSFPYGSKRMEEEVTRYLPQEVERFETADGRLGLRVSKDPELLMLSHVKYYYRGLLDPKHVAWIQSTLHNFTCYLNYAKIVHHDISLDTYFISPEKHSGALLGGWWYAKKAGDRLERIPARTFQNLPWEAQLHKKALPITDLELVRAVGRELSGPSTPEPMVEWFRSIATEHPIENYRGWGEVLKASFGKKRFTKMELTPDQLYQEIGYKH
jgi:hypothetical protein